MWTLGGNRIYVQEHNLQRKQVIARLQPLAGGTVIQTYGYENPVYTIVGKVVGETILSGIMDLPEAGATCTLVADQTNYTVYVASVNATRDSYIWQSIDPTQDCYTPVFTVTIELME